jgi:hypothetical protein
LDEGKLKGSSRPAKAVVVVVVVVVGLRYELKKEGIAARCKNVQEKTEVIYKSRGCWEYVLYLQGLFLCWMCRGYIDAKFRKRFKAQEPERTQPK